MPIYISCTQVQLATHHPLASKFLYYMMRKLHDFVTEDLQSHYLWFNYTYIHLNAVKYDMN